MVGDIRKRRCQKIARHFGRISRRQTRLCPSAGHWHRA
jgi:hypothetical protein